MDCRTVVLYGANGVGLTMDSLDGISVVGSECGFVIRLCGRGRLGLDMKWAAHVLSIYG
jgi:hypothetical protein